MNDSGERAKQLVSLPINRLPLQHHRLAVAHHQMGATLLTAGQLPLPFVGAAESCVDSDQYGVAVRRGVTKRGHG